MALYILIDRPGSTRLGSIQLDYDVRVGDRIALSEKGGLASDQKLPTYTVTGLIAVVRPHQDGEEWDEQSWEGEFIELEVERVSDQVMFAWR